jgi:hypothetical protein
MLEAKYTQNCHLNIFTNLLDDIHADEQRKDPQNTHFIYAADERIYFKRNMSAEQIQSLV